MPVELGVNPLRLHCLSKVLDAGRIGCKSIQIDAGRIGCKSIEITLPFKGFKCQSNSTSQIGCKSIEITLPVKGFRCQSNLTGQIGCKSIQIDAGRIWWKSIEIMPNLTRQAYNVISMNFYPI